MKKRKTIVSLFAVAVAFVLAFQGSITASAAGTTYVLRFDAEENEWKYQVGSAWDDSAETRELYYLEQNIKNDDLVVIEGTTASSTALNLDVHLSNLTVNRASTVVVGAKGIDNCYILTDSVAAVNGDISNAYVYGTAAVTFNNSISNLQIIGETELSAHVTVAGTVGRLTGKDNDGTYYDYYNVASGRLVIEDGTVKTEEQYYSKTAGGAQQPAAQAPAQTPSQPAASSGAGQNNADEYDDVPKTGDHMAYLWLLGIAVVCFAGKYTLKKL